MNSKWMEVEDVDIIPVRLPDGRIGGIPIDIYEDEDEDCCGEGCCECDCCDEECFACDCCSEDTERSVGIEDLIEDVIFNGPATIVFWTDGAKTVVKCCDKDHYDKEKGLAMAIVKRLCSSPAEFHSLFDFFCDDDE